MVKIPPREAAESGLEDDVWLFPDPIVKIPPSPLGA
jgi:hypothetical protein